MATGNQLSTAAAVKKLYQVISLDKRDISAVYILAVLAGVVQLSLPLGIQTIISFVMAGSISTSIIVLILLVVLGTFLYGLLQVRQLEIIEKIKQKIFVRYGFEFSDRIPRLDLEKLRNYYLPEVMNRFFDTVSLQKGLEKLLLDLPAAVIQVCLGLVLLAFYHPVFVGFGMLLLFIVVLIFRLLFSRGFSLAMQSSDYKYRLVAWLQETARVVNSFKYSAGEFHLSKTNTLIEGHLEARTSYFKVLLVQFWSLISFKTIVTAAMLIVGTVLLVDQQINIGQFIAADIVIITIIASVEKLILSLDKVYDALVSVEKLAKVSEADKETGGNLLLEDGGGVAIEFMNTSVGYPGDGHLISQLKAKIEPGQLIHISGPSGSGKSTLFRLLTGVYKSYEGNILIDAQPISNYSLQSLRSSTGVLLSSQDIFEGTVWENLTMGNNAVSAKEVSNICEVLGLSSFIQANKHGYSMMLDPLGKRLSKQLRQKILLTRALIGEKKLLLLEEPFQHLDASAAAALATWLRSLRGTTVLIASADKSISAYCDGTINLEEYTALNNIA